MGSDWANKGSTEPVIAAQRPHADAVFWAAMVSAKPGGGGSSLEGWRG